MIIKKISCEVKLNHKEAFFEQQKKWKPVSKMKGFLGQMGGWNIKQPSTACIYSFWENKTDYEQFMKEEHDQIYKSTGQEHSYQSIDVSLFQEIQWVPGKAEDIVHICRTSKYIRVAMAQIKEDNTEHFVDMQRKVWNTGMQQSEGMLGGTFAISEKNRNEFLVVTGWKSEEDHSSYLNGHFPELLKAANPKDDVLELKGEQFEVLEAWRINPK